MELSGISYAKICIIFSMLIMTMGCGSPKVKVNVAADQSLNQDNQQRSLPVVLRVYQLSARTKFEQADFKQIWKQDSAFLGSELLAKEEYLVHPGKKSTLKYPKVEGAKYVGVVGLFRNTEQHQWQIIKPVGQSPISKHLSSTLRIRMKDNTIGSTL